MALPKGRSWMQTGSGLGLGLGLAAVVWTAPAEAQGVARAAPCSTVRLDFGAAALPPGARVAHRSATATIEAPYVQEAVLVNRSAEPLYLAIEAAPLSASERAGSGIPATLQPFYKLAAGRVYEWRQDPSRSAGRDQRLGQPLYGWTWRLLDEAHHLRRNVGSRMGLALRADVDAYLKTVGGPQDVTSSCSGPAPAARAITLHIVHRGKARSLTGSAHYERVAR